MDRFSPRNAVILLAMFAGLTTGCATNKAGLQRLSAKQVDAMERRADAARTLVVSNRCAEAALCFEELSEPNTISRTLYRNEMGTSLFLDGRWQEAKGFWRDALTDVELFFDPKTEKKALSLFGAEARKVYKGDPYERATLCLLLGLVYLDAGDVDNALAMFKNASLHEFDTTDSKYPSDFALLQALEARCHRLRGDLSTCREVVKQAESAFKAAHPFFSAHLTQVRTTRDGLSKASKDKALAALRPIYQNQLSAASTKLKSVEEYFSEDIPDKELVEPLLAADYNVLVLIYVGSGPHKYRTGKYGETTVWQPALHPNLPDRYEAYLEKYPKGGFDAIPCVAEISSQALSQRGRQMSEVLRGKASTKDKAHKLAKSCFDAAGDICDNAKGEAAMIAAPIAAGLLVVGGVSKVVAWNVDPRADIRVWRTLPGRMVVLPLKLRPGSHNLILEGYDFIVPRSRCSIDFDVGTTDGVQVELVRVLPDGRMCHVEKGAKR